MDFLLPLLTSFAAVDLFFNSPLATSHRKRNGALLTSLVAAGMVVVAGGEGSGLVLMVLVAQTVWVVLLVEYVVTKQVVTEQIQPSTKPSNGKEGDDILPVVLDELMQDSRSKFERNLDAATNVDGCPWKLVLEDSGVRVYQSDYPGQSCKRWKIECEIMARKEDIFEQIFEYEVRCGGSSGATGWDPSVASGKVMKTWKQCKAGDECYLSIYYTAPAAGGAVSSRELVDLGVLVNLPDGGIEYVNTSVKNEHVKVCKEIPTSVIGVRAFTHRGSGMSIRPVDPTNPQNVRWKYVMVNALDLQGWLPTSLVNRATTDALKGSHVLMISHMKTILEKKR